MPRAYGQIAGIKHPPNGAAPEPGGAVPAEPEAPCRCASCGTFAMPGELKDGLCRECAYERSIPVPAARMRRRMRLAGITAASVAHALHVNPNTMRNYVSGKTSPPLTVFAGMCREIGMTPNEVLGFEAEGGGR